jgi:hypothetical protein
MDYGEILSKAWKIIWKHKILWLFGILAGCGSAGGNSSSNTGYRFQESNPISPEINRLFNGIGNVFRQIPVWAWVLVAVIFLFLFVLVIFLNTIGRIGLITGAKEADQGANRLSLGQLFNASLPFFWRVFCLNLLAGIASLVITLILLIPLILFSVVTLGIGLLCLIPFVCVLIPLLWALGIVVEQCIIAMVVENIGIFDGLARGWKVVTGNIGQIVIMSLILVIGGGIVGLIIALPAALTALPILLAIAINSNALQVGLAISALIFIVYLPFLLLFTGILQAYLSTAWTLTYMRLTAGASTTPNGVQVNPITPTDPQYNG